MRDIKRLYKILALCFLQLVKKFSVFSLQKDNKFLVLRDTYAIKYMQLQEKSINLLYSRYLCAPQGWNDRYRSYSTSSDTVSGIDPTRRYCDVLYMRPAYRKPMSIFSPRLYMRWREDVCSLVRNYRNLNYFKRLSTPFPQCCEPKCLSTHLDWTARLWRCRGFSFECSVFNFFHPQPLFRSFFFFVENISLSSSTDSTSPAMQIVFCRKTCKVRCRRSQRDGTDVDVTRNQRREGWVVEGERRPRLRKHRTRDLRVKYRRHRKIKNPRLHGASLSWTLKNVKSVYV